MKEILVDENVFARLKKRAEEKGITITDYISLLVPLTEKADK